MPSNLAASVFLFSTAGTGKGLSDRLHGASLIGAIHFILPHHLTDYVRPHGVLPADNSDPFDGILQFPDVA